MWQRAFLFRLLQIIVAHFVPHAAADTCLLSVHQSLQHSIATVDESMLLHPMREARIQAVSKMLCPYRNGGTALQLTTNRSAFEQLWKGPSSAPLHLLESKAASEPPERPRLTCAVVSNSGALLKHKHGAEIDAADVVFRFTDGPSGGEFEEIVGARDDFRFVSYGVMESLMRQVYESGTPLNSSAVYVLQLSFLQPFQEDFFKTMLRQLVGDQRMHPDIHMMMAGAASHHFAQQLMAGFYGEAGWRKLTTGFLSVLITMAVCDEVRAYGFPETPASKDAPFHYFGPLKTGSASQNAIHEGTASEEKQLWRAISLNDDVDDTDVAVLPGWNSLRCESGWS
mmetsp:Transcript_17378/g.40541  ORF Transcript_17378/g.40541 Transcript_17378/m.40541 type:complete len:340 (-) Transcript_17378:36-1055(-)